MESQATELDALINTYIQNSVYQSRASLESAASKTLDVLSQTQYSLDNCVYLIETLNEASGWDESPRSLRLAACSIINYWDQFQWNLSYSN